MWLQHIDDSILVTAHPLHNRLAFLVPKEDVGAVGTANDKFTLWTEEIHACEE